MKWERNVPYINAFFSSYSAKKSTPPTGHFYTIFFLHQLFFYMLDITYKENMKYWKK